MSSLEEKLKLENKPFYLEGCDNKDHACLLLHGLGGGAYEMQFLGDTLHKAGYGAKGLIYPGHSENTPEMPTSYWTEWFDFILDNYQDLSKKYSKVSLVGFSTGCPLSIKLALQEKIEKIVLLSPFMDLKYKWFYLFPLESYVRALAPLVRKVPRTITKLYDQNMRQMVKEVSRFKTFNLDTVKSIMDLIVQVKPKLKDITSPTLIIQSIYDHVVDPKGAQYLNNNINAEDKELIWLHNSKHTITLDHDRLYVYNKVIEFLEKKTA